MAAWPTLILVTAGLFLAVLSTTVVSVALPTIGRDLHASAAGLEWTVDAYVLVYASLLLASGVPGTGAAARARSCSASGCSGWARWPPVSRRPPACCWPAACCRERGRPCSSPAAWPSSGSSSPTSGSGPRRSGWPLSGVALIVIAAVILPSLRRR